MTSMDATTAKPPRRRPAVFRDCQASTAIEFAIVGGLVLLWIITLFILGQHFLTQASIEAATHMAARQMQVGAIRTGSADEVRRFICPRLASLIAYPCSSLQVYATSGTSFAALTSATMTGTTLSRTGYVPGGLSSYVLLQVGYSNPNVIPMPGMSSLTILSSVAFKNEP